MQGPWRFFPPTLLRAAATASAALAAPAAWGQEAAPPQPQLTTTAAPWVGLAIMFLLLAAVLGVSLMPSKRGHRD